MTTTPPPWTAVIVHDAERQLGRLARTDRERIRAAIRQLPSGGDVRKLKGFENVWRLRVGDRRVIFTRDLDAHKIQVLAVGARGGIYW